MSINEMRSGGAFLILVIVEFNALAQTKDFRSYTPETAGWKKITEFIYPK